MARRCTPAQACYTSLHLTSIQAAACAPRVLQSVRNAPASRAPYFQAPEILMMTH